MRARKHINCKDVFIEILKVFDGGKYYKVKVNWWSCGQVKPYPLHLRQKLKIKKKDWKNWKYYEVPL